MSEEHKKDWMWALRFLRSLQDPKGKHVWTYVQIAGAINGSEKSVRRWMQQGVKPMPVHCASLLQLGLRVERERRGLKPVHVAS